MLKVVLEHLLSDCIFWWMSSINIVKLLRQWAAEWRGEHKFLYFLCKMAKQKPFTEPNWQDQTSAPGPCSQPTSASRTDAVRRADVSFYIFQYSPFSTHISSGHTLPTLLHSVQVGHFRNVSSLSARLKYVCCLNWTINKGCLKNHKDTKGIDALIVEVANRDLD